MLDSEKIAHMTVVQGVISRLETNAFTLKTLALTFVAALLAFVSVVDEVGAAFLVAAILLVVVLWVMDARYLRLGRLYRRLYDGLRKGEEIEPFSMDTSDYDSAEQSVVRIAFSWSICGFYLSVLVVLTVVFVCL